MKIRNWAVLGFALSVVLAGCKGFWDLPASTTTTTSTTLSSGIFYVLNQTTKQIAGYSISSGTLTNVSGSPYSLGAATPFCFAISPGGGYLYVGTDNGVYLYTVGSAGALSLQSSGQTINSDIPAALLVDTSGSWLVAAYINASNLVEIDAIPLSTSTGLSTASASNPVEFQTFNITNATVKQMVESSDGDNLFLALGSGGTIVVPFTSGNTNPLSSTATTIGTANSSGSAQSVAVDPTNRIFYIGETLANSGNSGGLRAFNYTSLGTGVPRTTPTNITGSPIASGGLSPNAILPLSGGEYLYVANGQGNTASGNVAWFPITASGTTYTIASGSSITSGIYPVGLAEDSDDNFVLAVATGGSTSSGNPDLEAFTISSGALTAAITSTTGSDPVTAIAIGALPPS